MTTKEIIEIMMIIIGAFALLMLALKSLNII